MINQMLEDLNNCRYIISSGNITKCMETYNNLLGKYSHLNDFPRLDNNQLFLSHHPNTYINYLQIIEGYLERKVCVDSIVGDVNKENINYDYSKVFIVHGHDEALKQTVARIIEKQDINAIILHEQANQGATIIEKIENNSDVGAAICLFTPDDIGKANNDENDNPRARQNVVFEAGYFMGKLGRNKVIFIADPSVEMPSDLQGVVYTNSNNWEIDLARELKAMGFNIDLNKLFEKE